MACMLYGPNLCRAQATHTTDACQNTSRLEHWFGNAMQDTYTLSSTSLSRAATQFSIPAWRTITHTIQTHHLLRFMADHSIQVTVTPQHDFNLSPQLNEGQATPTWLAEQTFVLTYRNRAQHQWQNSHHVTATIQCDAGNTGSPFVITAIHDKFEDDTDYQRPTHCPPIDLTPHLDWQFDDNKNPLSLKEND